RPVSPPDLPSGEARVAAAWHNTQHAMPLHMMHAITQRRMPVKFVHADSDGATFKNDGLREIIQYRHLGLTIATDRRDLSHLLRAVPGKHPVPQWHSHTMDFQMVYVLKGWTTFEYEGQGRRTLRVGDCVLQPPGIRHREIEHSDDLELIEITS